MFSALLVLSLVTGSAIAAPDGDDIAAWRQLCAQQLEGDEQIAALRSFALAYPESLLAEVAWGELQEAGAIDEDLGSDERMAPVERSFRAHQAALERRATHTAVARLDADGTQTIELPSRFQGAVIGGIGYDGSAVSGQVGARIERGPVSLTTRLGAGQRPWAAAGARLSATASGPWIEADIDSLGRVDTMLGARHRLDDHVWLEGAAGAMISDGKALPAVRFEIARSFSGPTRTLVR